MMAKMHVMHLRASNFVGGPERQILEHVRRAESDSLHLSLCCFRDNGQASELEEAACAQGLDCSSVKARWPFDLGTIMELTRMIKARKVDLLVTHGYKPNLLGRVASWVAGIPTVAVSRGWTYESRRVRFYEFLDRIFLRLADGVVAVSEGQRQKILACDVKPDKVRVIHNAIDLATYPGPAEKSVRDELGIPQDAILVVTAGRLSPEKNHLGLVEAARMVLAKMPDVYFVIFGEGFLRPELEKAVADAGIGHRFFLPGFRSDVRSLLHESDIFVLPSHTEGLPNVVLEAFACHKPVVATSVGGTPEVVRHGQNGFLIQLNGMEDLATYLATLCASADMRHKMGEKGYQFVKEQFGYEQQTRLYLDIYERMKN
jgi:glycosyltransferase involved in cell wall biosynthesis